MRRSSKFRGHRTHGRGKKAGRGAGKRGGKGNAGLHKHKWSWTLKYDPDHFGRHGFNRDLGLYHRPKTLNVKDLDQMAKKSGIAEMNLTEMGIGKLLGSGKIEKPITVIVAEASPSAIQKIETAGGSVSITKKEAGKKPNANKKD